MEQFIPNSGTAMIFNIQHFCIHDGPGIRTVVFFNGCPLTCPWCCNPESCALRPVLLYNKKNCVLCGRCAQVCPVNAVSIEDGIRSMNPELCTSCGRCVEECGYDALELSGRVYTLEEAAEEILKDQAFFEKSGGGVTYSGGEALMQIGFLEKLSQRLRSKGIHIACETTAALESDRYCRLLDSVDYVMMDIKHYDEKRLLKVCHADLGLIRENIRETVKRQVPLIGRIPVIPGFNASMEDMEGFAKFGRELGIKEYHLLAFHQLGEEKYERLQRNYQMKGVLPLHKEDLEEYADYLSKQGFHVEIGR